jgi:hypothetical protein
MKFFSVVSSGARRLHPLPSIVVALAVGMAVAAATRAAPAEGEVDARRPVGEHAAGAGLPALPNIVADDTQAPAAPANAAPASDRVSQENIFWASVQKSNTLADYKAYLEAYPNGAFAPLARNRIAAMAPAAETPLPSPPAAGPPAIAPPPLAPPAQNQRPSAPLQSGPAEPGPLQQGPGPAQAEAPQNDENMNGAQQSGPAPGRNAPSAEALSAEVGTAETEQALNLNRRDARVLQERLAAQGLYSGPIDGDLGPGSRAAIAGWQQRQGAAPTGFLGPLILGTLQTEGGPVNGERIDGQGCPPGFHPGRYGRRCWVDR